MATTVTTTKTVSYRRLLRGALLASASATLLNTLLYFVMFFTPFTIPAAPALTIVVLELMHVVVAAAAVWAVRQA